jgi:acetylornithine deacetylase
VERARVDQHRLIDLLRRLVAVDSVNPSLVPQARGEGEVAALVARECRQAGLDVHTEEVVANRPNVIARVRGGDPGRRLLLNGHMDTVGVEGMREPFGGVVLGRQLFGRGAYDMKAGLAAMVEAGRVLADGGLAAGELVLAFVVDEEYASIGTADLIRRYPAGALADAAIVTEPTALDVCVAHKGFVWARLETAGRAAHGSQYRQGEDAIARMGHVLVALDRLEREVLPRRRHRLLERPSLHASTIRGGLGLSTYPDRCVLEIERRTLPGETDEMVMAELQGAMEEAARSSPGLDGRVEILLSRPPFEISEDASIVRVLADSVRDVRGQPPRLVGEFPWFDAALLGEAGIPTVMFGPAGAGAHAAEEWVDLLSVATCAEVLVETARRFCAGER